jgi:uncharacterized protein GlcG (DUF336 family)
MLRNFTKRRQRDPEGLPKDVTYTKTTITHELAARMAAAAITGAKELGARQNVAVLDEGGNLKAFGRMDGVDGGNDPVEMKTASHRHRPTEPAEHGTGACEPDAQSQHPHAAPVLAA